MEGKKQEGNQVAKESLKSWEEREGGSPHCRPPQR